MATIGLYDADMAKYNHVLFNLDLMKLSTYYKNKRQLVKLITELDLERYSKIIYRKDYYDGTFDSCLTDSSIEFGGRAFSADKYVPLPDEIERLRGDRYIYESVRNRFSTNRKMTNIFDQMMRAQHLRLSLDGKTIWNNYTSQLVEGLHNKTLILHDYDLGQIPEAAEVILDLQNSFNKKFKKFVGMKFPVNTYDTETLVKWAQFYPMGQFYFLRYNGLMKDEDLVYFYQRTLGTSMINQTEYLVTYGCKTEEEFIERLPKIFRQLVYLRSKRKRILLRYDKNLFIDKMWIQVLRLITHYYHFALDADEEFFRRLEPFDSMYSFVKYFYIDIDYKVHWSSAENERMSQKEGIEVFKFLQEKCYPLFCDFYECHMVKLKGGNFELC